MLEAKAEYLYNLPQWDAIFSPEKRREIQKAYRESCSVRNENKVGRNDGVHVEAERNIKNVVENNFHFYKRALISKLFFALINLYFSVK